MIDRRAIYYGSCAAPRTTLMLAAAAIAWRFGIATERKPFEEVRWPLAFLE